ncbi:hypothetical protein AcV5_006519 [Taiwanofungus camphoratus]|nr:hypothetical protein AcW2_004960 [Antrodia cinnamomea]KAI0934788.1 hypothetical protein AcV5_006519 [Antrodia cinnamomea]
MPETSSLPIELWLQIFRWATISPLTHRLRATTYSPFDTAPIAARDEATRTKTTLVLVCKQWRRLTMELLYEDVQMGCPEQLQSVLEGKSLDGGDEPRSVSECSRWVRRACLPYSSSATTTARPLKAVRLLEQCPYLETLVRMDAAPGDMLSFEFAADCPPLVSLKRLDWWHHGEAARTGGINSLSDVLRAAPNLQYLSLGGFVTKNFLAPGPPVPLPSLTTLRILRMNVLFVLQMCRWSMPVLTHLIIDTVEDIYMLESFWEKFGAQIRTVELGHSLKYYIRDSLSMILPGCPNLEELNYYVHFTAVPYPFHEAHPLLTTVGLHAHATSFIPVGSTEYWRRIEDHFAVLSRPLFPALKKIVLYGDWDAVMTDVHFPSLVQTLLARGCRLERSEN